ncbi:MAG: 1,4-dihydroxy-2-naphthoate octaprenyltransferase [Bacteroidales bacterium]|nr:1,4-dihydroxy-2-naphthoate octaprenyltransferase [Bacteroidales bacterium]
MLKTAVRSMRLRTLPLSLSGIVLGVFLASMTCTLNWFAVLLLILTAVFLQILSNLSNELGDALHGENPAERQGIAYPIQTGEVTTEQLRRMVVFFAALSAVTGLGMIWASFGSLIGLKQALFVLLGACAIVAALRYTLGPKPYGYRGLGDIAVFIFFGLVTVCGAYYLMTTTLPPASILLPASSIGCLSVAVLNVNNIRDMKSDAATRRTVALRLGLRGARIYQTCLIVGAWLMMAAFLLMNKVKPAGAIFILTMPVFCFHLKGVWTRTDRELDPMLPMLVMGTFLFALLSGIAVTL